MGFSHQRNELLEMPHQISEKKCSSSPAFEKNGMLHQKINAAEGTHLKPLRQTVKFSL
jgi:hypothetical protein